MASKRASTGTKTPKRKTAAAAVPSPPILTDEVVIGVLESSGSTESKPSGIDPERRRQLVAAEAYFLAERRGFTAGRELEDWVTAEAVVDSRLQESEVA
jgi:hypothetical protein